MVELEIIPNSKIDDFTSMFLTSDLKEIFESKYSFMINFDMCIRDMVWELCATQLIPTYVQKEIEDCLLKKAIQEQYIRDADLKFIPRINDTKNTNSKVYIRVEEFTNFLWNKIRINIHFETINHQRFLCKEIYKKMNNELNYFILPKYIIDIYELNKLSLVASLAYTLQKVHKMSWHTTSLRFIENHLNEIKYYPQTVKGIKQEIPSTSWLYMSLLNLMIYRCNHKYNGRINVVSLRDLTKFSKKKLAYYTEEDKQKIQQIVRDIKTKTVSECSLF